VSLYRQWRAIQQRAGIRKDPVKGWYDFRSIRKTAGTELAARVGVEQAAQCLGHSPGVFSRHYDSGRAARQARAVAQLPDPFE
jgi:hypothetical protein